MTLFDLLLAWDQSLFLFINHFPHGALLDTVGILLSAGSGFFWFFLIILFLYRHNRRLGKKAIISLILAGILTQMVAVLIFKPFFARSRPDQIIKETITVISWLEGPLVSKNSSDYAFPSGHATMAFAGAAILTKIRPKHKLYWFFLATLVGLSRIYLGKHFPGDILAGAILGWGIGWMAIKISNFK